MESMEPSSRFESDDGSVDSMSALEQWGKFFVEGGKAIGRPFTVFEDGIVKKAMEEAGFVDITIQDFKVSPPCTVLLLVESEANKNRIRLEAGRRTRK